MGTASDITQTAFAAVSAGRFDELASLLAPELDWWGLDEQTGAVAHCHGRETALGLMRRGVFASGLVDVEQFVEQGDLVLAHARRPSDGTAGAVDGRERWVVAEVQDGLVARIRAFPTERAALAALELGTLAQ